LLRKKESRTEKPVEGEKMSVSYNVEKTCLRYVIPFQYEGTFLDALHRVEAQPGPLWRRKTVSDRYAESDLYRYIREEFLFEEKEKEPDEKKAGCTWSYRNKNSAIQKLYYYPAGATLADGALSPGAPVAVSDAALLLFRNGLGFLWYELAIPEMDSGELVRFQNQIRELNRGGKSRLWEMPKGKDMPIEKPFSFGYWVQELLGGLKIGVRYFAERKSAWYSILKKSGCAADDGQKETRMAPDKAILFSYYALHASGEEDPREQGALAYELTNGYNDRYCCSDETIAAMKHPFANVIFYATQEGAAYLAWTDEKNRQVFGSTIYTKVRNDYFTLYLKVLYQSFSLLIYAQKTQAEISVNQKGASPLSASMNGLLEEINLFLAKSMATSVSHIHHQSEFYVYLKRQLRIHEDVKSVTAGLDALGTLQKEQYEQRERESDNQISAIMGLFALLGISSALVDCFDFITRFFDGETWAELGGAARGVECVCMLLIAVVSLAAIWFAVKAIRSAFRRKNKKN
jgi:hypothetical protein